MLNQVVLVGRLTSDMEVKESEDGKKYCNMSLAIPRSFKNADGVYDTDFVNIKIFDTVAQNTSELPSWFGSGCKIRYNSSGVPKRCPI